MENISRGTKCFGAYATNKNGYYFGRFPIGTIVRVTNLQNGLSIIVPIIDRGPYIGERIIDLSEAAFAKIAPLEQGIIPVQIEILSATPGIGKPGKGE